MNQFQQWSNYRPALIEAGHWHAEYPSRLTSRSQWSVPVLIDIAVWQGAEGINLCDVPFSIIVVFVRLARGFSRLSCLQSILTASIIHFHGLSQSPASSSNLGLKVHKKPSVLSPKKQNVERSMESPVGWKKVDLPGTTQCCFQLSCSLSFCLGADIDAPDAYGYTPLMNAAMLGRLDVVKALIESGADIQTKGQFGYTALHAAAQGGHLDVVQALVKYGASVNCKNDDGDIPLILGSFEREGWHVIVFFSFSSGSRNSCWDHRLPAESRFGYSSKRLARPVRSPYSKWVIDEWFDSIWLGLCSCQRWSSHCWYAPKSWNHARMFVFRVASSCTWSSSTDLHIRRQLRHPTNPEERFSFVEFLVLPVKHSSSTASFYWTAHLFVLAGS